MHGNFKTTPIFNGIEIFHSLYQTKTTTDTVFKTFFYQLYSSNKILNTFYLRSQKPSSIYILLYRICYFILFVFGTKTNSSVNP